MVSRPAEGGCFCLATVSSLSPASGAAQVQVTVIAFSLAQESTPRPLHSPAAFLLASEYATVSSPAGDHACVCVCFILCYRIPYIAYVVSPALAPIVSQSCEYITAAATSFPMDCPSVAMNSTAAAPSSSRVQCPPIRD